MSEKQTEPAAGELTIVPEKDKANASVEIIPFGTNDRIRLSAAIVRQMIAVPTRSKKLPDDNQCIKFIMLCKARHLNPFEGDAYMIGYDTQDGAQFSLITAHQVFLKRAEASKDFKGMQSGVIVAGQTPSEPVEREGDIVYDGEKLVGGWAKVYKKNLDHPFYRRLKLATFNTGRSRWEKDPAGMICKCAEADALRTAFPTLLGGLYIEEEAPPITIGEELKIARPKIERIENQTTTVVDQPEEQLRKAQHGLQQQPEPMPEPQPETAAPLKPKKKRATRSTEPEPAPLTPYGEKQVEIETRLKTAGFTTDHLLTVARANDWITEDEQYPLTEEKLTRFLAGDNWDTILGEIKALPQ